MYRIMDQEEIEIRQMDSLKMLHLYQLGGSDAIAVYYGDNKQINLCAMDKNYNLLMERVLTLYSQCQDKNSIIIDASAKKLMEAAVARGDNYTSFFNRIGKKYMNMEALDSPRFASDGIVRETLMPMIQYYIKQLYHMFDLQVEFEGSSKGWNKNCVIKLKRDKDTFVLPARMALQNTNSYKIVVGNFIKDMNIIEFDITYSDNRLLIVFECKELALVGENRVHIQGSKVNSVTSVTMNGHTVYYMNEDIPHIKDITEDAGCKNVLKYADIDPEYSRIYQLPWGGHVVSRLVEAANESTRRIDVDTIYVDEHNTKACVRHYSYGLVENIKDGLKLRTDGAIMRKLYNGDKHGDMETLFLPVGYYSGWDYKEFLEDKYYYESMEDAR